MFAVRSSNENFDKRGRPLITTMGDFEPPKCLVRRSPRLPPSGSPLESVAEGLYVS